MDTLSYVERSIQNNGDARFDTHPTPPNWSPIIEDDLSSHPHHSLGTFSEPEESTSSDMEYFDEDDMYYASYDDESVRSSPEPVSESSSDTEDMVWLLFSWHICRWSDI